MKIRAIYYQLRYDLKQGILSRWRWYLIAVIIFALQWLVAYKNMRFLSNSAGTYIDYVLFCFRGLVQQDISNASSQFELPIYWMCVFIGTLVCSIGYSGVDTTDISLQIAIRVGSRKIWWFSKLLWCICSILVYFFFAYVTLATLCVTADIPLSLSNTPEFYFVYFNSEHAVSEYAICLSGNILLGFIMPCLFALIINMFQLTISLFISKSRAFLLSIAVLVLSSYYRSKLAIGNYAIVMRSSLVVENGFEAEDGIKLFAFLIALFLIIGFMKISYLDFLPKSKERV